MTTFSNIVKNQSKKAILALAGAGIIASTLFAYGSASAHHNDNPLGTSTTTPGSVLVIDPEVDFHQWEFVPGTMRITLPQDTDDNWYTDDDSYGVAGDGMVDHRSRILNSYVREVDGKIQVSVPAWSSISGDEFDYAANGYQLAEPTDPLMIGAAYTIEDFPASKMEANGDGDSMSVMAEIRSLDADRPGTASISFRVVVVGDPDPYYVAADASMPPADPSGALEVICLGWVDPKGNENGPEYKFQARFVGSNLLGEEVDYTLGFDSQYGDSDGSFELYVEVLKDVGYTITMR